MLRLKKTNGNNVISILRLQKILVSVWLFVAISIQ